MFSAHICAGVGGTKDVCQGDSGGGMVVKEDTSRLDNQRTKGTTVVILLYYVMTNYS